MFFRFGSVVSTGHTTPLMAEAPSSGAPKKCARPEVVGTSESSITVKLTVPGRSVLISDVEVRYTSAADPPTSGREATVYWGGGNVEVESVKERLPSHAHKALEPFSEHEHTLSGLKPATTYTVRVRAKGSNGRCGQFSAAASFKTAEYLEPLEAAPATAVQSASDQDPSLLVAQLRRRNTSLVQRIQELRRELEASEGRAFELRAELQRVTEGQSARRRRTRSNRLKAILSSVTSRFPRRWMVDSHGNRLRGPGKRHRFTSDAP